MGEGRGKQGKIGKGKERKGEKGMEWRRHRVYLYIFRRIAYEVDSLVWNSVLLNKLVETFHVWTFFGGLH